MYSLKYLSVLAAVWSLPASGAYTNPADSVKSTELEEIVVEGKTRTATAVKSTYYPTKEQKKHAYDGTSLLMFMGIPELTVIPGSNSISTITGAAVNVYINYVPASEYDLDGLRPSDVAYVEYLPSPTDPRFQNNSNVVNFIVRYPETGGYTRLSTSQDIFSNFNSSSGIISKLYHKDMIFDLYVGERNVDMKHTGTSVDETFKGIDIDGVRTDLKRTTELGHSDGDRSRWPVNFRAQYTTDKITISNSLGYAHDSNSGSSDGRLLLTPSQGADMSYRSDVANRSNSISWNGMYYFRLPHRWSINFVPSIDYSHTNMSNGYATDAPGASPIDRRAYDNSLNIQGSLHASTMIGNLSSIFGEIRYSRWSSKVHYTEPVFFDRFSNDAYIVKAGYNFGNQRIQIKADAGIVAEYNRINGNLRKDFYPSVHLLSMIATGSDQVLRLWFQYATTSPEQAERTPNEFRENEYMWVSGNPDVRDNRHFTADAQYWWQVSKAFSMTPYVSYYCAFDRLADAYGYHYDGNLRDGVLRHVVNNGDYHSLLAGVNANLQLLSGRLNISAMPRYTLYKSTGICRVTKSYFYTQLYANYLFGDFYVAATMFTPEHKLSERGVCTDRGLIYHIMGGWQKWNLSVQVVLSNIFRNSYKTQTSWIDSDVFSRYSTTYSVNSRRRVRISLAYTFSYGKKVSKSDEISDISGAESGILK